MQEKQIKFLQDKSGQAMAQWEGRGWHGEALAKRKATSIAKEIFSNDKFCEANCVLFL